MTLPLPRTAADEPRAPEGGGPAALRPWLAENRLFRGVPAETLEALIEVPELVSLGEGEVLFGEGGEGDFLYLVASGSVRVSRGGGGRPETHAHFLPGDFFGETALLDLEPRAGRATATRPSVLGRVDRAAFERIVRMAPGRVSTNLAHGVAERMRGGSPSHEMTRAERMSLIGSMAALVAHDFKNPMSAILMAADLIAETSDNPDHAESAAVIRRGIGQMVALTEELLDFARGTPCVRTEILTPEEILAGLDEPVLARLRRDGIRVHRRLDWNGEMRADRHRLTRALCNLVRNAAEAMPDGGDLTLTVELRGDRAAFVVADTGRGIPAGLLPTLFEPFLPNGRSGSSGLGMAVARSVAEGHGGSVAARSTPGQGTVVELVVPIAGPPPLAG